MVCISRNLVWGTLSVMGTWLWNRLVRRFWLGLGSLGIQLARRIPDLWGPQVFLPQPHVLQPGQFLPGWWRQSLRRAWWSLPRTWRSLHGTRWSPTPRRYGRTG